MLFCCCWLVSRWDGPIRLPPWACYRSVVKREQAFLGSCKTPEAACFLQGAGLGCSPPLAIQTMQKESGCILASVGTSLPSATLRRKWNLQEIIITGWCWEGGKSRSLKPIHDVCNSCWQGCGNECTERKEAAIWSQTSSPRSGVILSRADNVRVLVSLQSPAQTPVSGRCDLKPYNLSPGYSSMQ